MKKLIIMKSSYPKYYNEYNKKNNYAQLWYTFMEEELNTHTHVYMNSHLLTLSATLTSAPPFIKYLMMSLRPPLSAALMRAVSPFLCEHNHGIEYIRRIPSHLKSNYIMNRIQSRSCTIWLKVTNYSYTYRGR